LQHAPRDFALAAAAAYNRFVAKDSSKTFEITCPDCGAIMKIDASNGGIITHTPAPKKRMFEDIDSAARAMRERDERKESIFRQSMENERNKADIFDKKFAEALKKAKESPDTGKPLRDFDLD
jgi:hypothetical protein